MSKIDVNKFIYDATFTFNFNDLSTSRLRFYLEISETLCFQNLGSGKMEAILTPTDYLLVFEWILR